MSTSVEKYGRWTKTEEQEMSAIDLSGAWPGTGPANLNIET